jgi:hypothetical protein
MDRTPDEITCQPMYVCDWRKLEGEIVTALQEQGYRISKNADGDLCCEQVNIAKLAQGLKRVVVKSQRVPNAETADRLFLALALHRILVCLQSGSLQSLEPY